MYCQVLHLNGSGTLDYGDTEGTTVPPNIYYSTRVLLVLYFLMMVKHIDLFMKLVTRT